MKKWIKQILVLVILGVILHGVLDVTGTPLIARHILVTISIFAFQFTEIYETISR